MAQAATLVETDVGVLRGMPGELAAVDRAAGDPRDVVPFNYAMRTLALMHDAGVKITAGSGVALLMPAPPVALLRELHLPAKAGLPLPASWLPAPDTQPRRPVKKRRHPGR
ncbi:hypothetical protein ABR738_02360 [Streptomyces sp. Edi4]|uniref:hypothetical protein n=1 Tax=Streptomyces sp. Edi4 TaxID=3162527 RepID=UPI003305E625